MWRSDIGYEGVNGRGTSQGGVSFELPCNTQGHLVGAWFPSELHQSAHMQCSAMQTELLLVI